jgi:asparagine synthase (glutamine-hydrolysing)
MGLRYDGPAAIGMRRLSIIDLAGSRQPIANEDGTIWVVFNGEIYNYQELRAELAPRHQLRTEGDTELLVHLYEELGDSMVERLRGMFAFALYDSRRRRLLIGRDRLGKKPLFYHWDGKRLVFASELKALLAWPDVPRQLDPRALDAFLALQYVPEHLCIFANVRKLPAAHTLTLEAGQLRTKRYWKLNFLPKDDLPPQALEEQVLAELREAVRLRMIADVPLGAFLSGGVDSALVVALMAEASDRPVRTFSVGFSDQAFSELPAAAAIASRFGTEHSEVVIEPDAAADLPAVVRFADEPFADPSALAMYYLCRAGRQLVTVALSGDGGDDLFGGYQRYAFDPIADSYARVPRPLRAAMDATLGGLPHVEGRLPLGKDLLAGARRLGQAAAVTPKASIARWGSYFLPEQRAALYSDEQRAAVAGYNPLEAIAASYDAACAEERLDRTLAADVEHYLAGDLLVKADRMSMAASLELRSPLLDHVLAERAARLPTHEKVQGRRTKALLRRVAERFVPREHLSRPKQGFALPVASWLRGEQGGRALRNLMADLLLTGPALQRGQLRPAAVEALVVEHLSGRRDHGKRLWALMVWELWQREYLD